MKLANCTMHDQTRYLDEFKKMGYSVNPVPLLREVNGKEDAVKAAQVAVQRALKQKAEGIILGGRTDLCIYIGLMAVEAGLKVFVVETKRVRYTDRNGSDYFRFNLQGLTPVLIGYTEGKRAGGWVIKKEAG